MKIDENKIKDDDDDDDVLLYKNSEMARMCGVTPKTWCVWVRKGLAPKPVRIGTTARWLKADVLKWCRGLKAKTKKGTMK
ncbi:hypothetical protein KAR91_44900 [Candidatus Pacearchaeota archaeon]|nr:hypothetical protein [Candidatus Pacearchaeota archaeon]